MPSSRFEIDDIILGRDFAILAMGDRRLLLENLSSDERSQLKAVRRNHDLTQNVAEGRIATALRRLGPSDADGHVRRPIRLSSRHMALIATPLRPLASRGGLFATAILSVLIYVVCTPWMVANLRGDDWTWPEQPAVTVVTAILLVGLSCLVHEIGHAAACLHATGATGGLTAVLSRRRLRLSIDVSCRAMASSGGRCDIALGGLIFQTGFSAFLIVAGMVFGQGVPILAAALILCVVSINLAPWKDNDGAQFLIAWANSPDLAAAKSTSFNWLLAVIRCLSLAVAVIALCAAIRLQSANGL